jgi:hypothetical protein
MLFNDEIYHFNKPQLKHLAKTLQLPISGNKALLIQRILLSIKQKESVIKIQKIGRGYLVRRFFSLLGKTEGCVNDTDFYTLEPFNEITRLHFFTVESCGQKFGFNLFSLIELYKYKKTPNNPYTREPISKQTEKDIYRFYSLLQLIPVRIKQSPPVEVEVETQEVETFDLEYFQQTVLYSPPIYPLGYCKDISRNQREKMIRDLEIIRSKSITQRINDLFIDICRF